MKLPALALLLILAAAAWRIAVVLEPALFNLSPVTALAFCAAVFFRDWRLWLVPFAALTLSDLWLNHYHAATFGHTWTLPEMVLRAAAIAAALGIGRLVARRPHWLNLGAGSLAGSLVFYVVTNTTAWAADPYYAGTAAGWWQAMTVGHPEFPPTLWFFRNTLAGDLIFTGVFAGALALAGLRVRAPAPERHG